MSRCYHCGEILSDEWVRKQGASLMGKKGGQAKARSSEQARAANKVRWDRQRRKNKT